MTAENNINILEKAIRITDIVRTSEQLGWSENELMDISQQVSTMIHDHNLEYPGQMLEQTPDVVAEFIKKRWAYIDVYHNGNGLEVLYFGKIEPLLSEKVSQMLGGYMVIETGSAITAKNYRQHGLGAEGAKARVAMARDIWGEDKTIVLSTIKQDITAGALKHAGMLPIGWKYPYIASLTCVCSTSELCGHGKCIYRRTPEDSTDKHFQDIVNKDVKVGTMPCTLVVSDIDLVEKFESECQKLHQQLGGQPVDLDFFDALGIRRAQNFFRHLERQLV